GADWGLAVLPGGDGREGVAVIALDTGEKTVCHERDFSGRPAELAMPWVVVIALDAVRRALL
ncbi:MAG: hypothetical protein QME94_12880, partial [Anaerolineae bacterium]|nr:hypothetical protein [Anaerolineae bacterium]